MIQYEFYEFYCKACGKHNIIYRNKQGRRREYCSVICRRKAWQKKNEWRRHDNCPRCGGLKRKESKRCRDCYKTAMF